MFKNEPTRKQKYRSITKDYDSKFPQGMKQFVSLWLDTDIHQTIQNKCRPQGILYNPNSDMRIIYYYHLINTFLNTKFKEIHPEYDEYKDIRSLPKESRYLAIDCLSWSLGMNPHNGNIHLLQIVKKFKDLQ